MHKLWTLFCLGLVLTSVYGQTCSDTSALRTYFGFANTVTTATAQTGINFCNSIKTGPVCCTKADMNSFQTKSDAAIATLTAQAAARDLALNSIGQDPKTSTAAIAASATTLTTAVAAKSGGLAGLITSANASGTLPSSYAGFGSYSTNVNPINTASPANPSGVSSNLPSKPASTNATASAAASGSGSVRLLQTIQNNTASTSVSLYGVLSNLVSIQTQLAAASSAAKSTVADYQTSRSTCIQELYKIQAASWCLSCDVNATLKGYDPTRMAFTMDSDVCSRLKNACYPYLTNSALPNAAFNNAMLLAALAYANSVLSSGGNPVGMTFIYTGQQPASLPASCTSAAACNWICTNLFNNGQVNTVATIDGGAVASTSSRLLEGEVAAAVEQPAMRPRQLAERVLASGTFNPSDNEAGTTVTFAADPAGITKSSNANSAMLTYGSVVGGMIAMIWSMMM